MSLTDQISKWIFGQDAIKRLAEGRADLEAARIRRKREDDALRQALERLQETAAPPPRVYANGKGH